MTKTGNKKIIYKPWEKMLMDILDVEKNPVFTKVPGAISVGVNEISVLNDCKSSNVPSQTSEVPSVTSLKKRKISTSLPETSETKHFSNTELQRLVLLEQLELIRLQKEKVKEQLKLIRAPKEKYLCNKR